jgi:DNA-binding GntR family transcriptional regulator
MGKLPVYKQMYNKLKKDITDGVYEVGDFLPTESELESIYSVSITTVRKVISLLVKDNLIEVRQGRGTTVLDYHSTQSLNGVTSVSETLRKQGYNVITKSIYIDKIEANKKIAMKLQLEEGASVYKIQRVLIADDDPTVIMENYIDVNLAPGLDKRADEIDSLYSFLEKNYNIIIESSTDIITATASNFIESQLLNIKPNFPLLVLKRITSDNIKPITYDKTIVRSDKYQFELSLIGRAY